MEKRRYENVSLLVLFFGRENAFSKTSLWGQQAILCLPDKQSQYLWLCSSQKTCESFRNFPTERDYERTFPCDLGLSLPFLRPTLESNAHFKFIIFFHYSSFFSHLSSDCLHRNGISFTRLPFIQHFTIVVEKFTSICCYRCRVHQQKHQNVTLLVSVNYLTLVLRLFHLSTDGLHYGLLKKYFQPRHSSAFLFHRTTNIILTENTHKNGLRLQMMMFTSVFPR